MEAADNKENGSNNELNNQELNKEQNKLKIKFNNSDYLMVHTEFQNCYVLCLNNQLFINKHLLEESSSYFKEKFKQRTNSILLNYNAELVYTYLYFIDIISLEKPENKILIVDVVNLFKMCLEFENPKFIEYCFKTIFNKKDMYHITQNIDYLITDNHIQTLNAIKNDKICKSNKFYILAGKLRQNNIILTNVNLKKNGNFKLILKHYFLLPDSFIKYHN